MAISFTATDDDALKAMAAFLGTTTGTGGGTGGTTPPPDTNAYPLSVPKPGTPGAPPAGADVTLGTGPNWIEYVACTGNDGPGKTRTDPATMSCFAIKLDTGLVIAGPLYVAQSTGEDGGQKFRINGAWGAGHDFIIEPGGDAQDLHDQWYNDMVQDFTACAYNGPPTSSGGETVNVLKGWNEFGLPMPWSTKLAATAPPPPPNLPAQQTTITGATINGVTVEPGTFAALVALSPANGTLQLPGGTFLATAQVNVPMTIKGTLNASGAKLTILDGGAPVLGAGVVGSIEPTQKKACIVPTAGTNGGLVVQDMIIQNYAINNSDGGNAAPIRQADPGYGFKAINVESRGNQNGWLTSGGGTVELDGCNTHDNGNGNPNGLGFTHEAYFGGGDFSATDASALKLTDSTFTCGLWSCHPIHCDVKQVDISGCKFVGNPGDGSTPLQQQGGSILDFPIGAVVNITDSDATMPAGAANREYIQVGEQSQPVAAVMNLTGLRLHGPAGFVAGASSWTLAIGAGCTSDTALAGAPSGFAGVTGAFVVGGAPGT